VAEKEDDMSSDDMMNEMFDVIRSKLETNSKDPPTLDVQKFFDMLLSFRRVIARTHDNKYHHFYDPS
jgi:hypothetical protein